MIKKTITYTDYDGNERKEDFYFNLSKAEVIEMELSNTGGLVKTAEKIASEQDGAKIMALFKSLIMKSVGEKSLDGKQFVKSDEIRKKFESTEAYSVLYMELLTDASKAEEFFNGLAPKE